jgi:hypothetical protein
MFIERTKEEMAAMDHFAGIALNYLLHETQLGHLLADHNNSTVTESCKKNAAEKAYDMAEAMLEAREDREAIYVEE